jgi:hypothetical protein
MFHLAGEFSVFAPIEYQPGQVKRFVRAELTGQSNHDIRGRLDADDGGRAGPVDDLRDSVLLRCLASDSVGPFVPR